MIRARVVSASALLPAPALRLVRESWSYLLVSIAALTLDYSLLVGLTALVHVNYLTSAAIGFTAGLILNYGLSIAFVFDERRLANPAMEFLIFAVIGLLGLGLNLLLMKLMVDRVHLGYALAKLPATGIGFIFNFGTRRALLFTGTRERV
jgi:putative flippase GtrA